MRQGQERPARDLATFPAGLEGETGEREVPGISGLGCCENSAVIWKELEGRKCLVTHAGTVRTGPEVGSHRMKPAVQEHVPSGTERTGHESEGCRRERDLGEDKRTDLAVVITYHGLSGPRRNSTLSQTEPPKRAESGVWERRLLGGSK